MTQPRVTCYRVGIRMNEPQMPALLVAHGDEAMRAAVTRAVQSARLTVAAVERSLSPSSARRAQPRGRDALPLPLPNHRAESKGGVR